MDQNTFENKITVQELQLSTLLEVTQAINNNLPEDQLYKIFYFTMVSSLSVKCFALYVKEGEQWINKGDYGTATDISQEPLPLEIINHPDHESFRCGMLLAPFDGFNQIIPVKHKNEKLAYVLLNDQEDVKFLNALINIIVVAIQNKKLAKKQLEQRALRKEMEIARDVQSYLIPENLPETDSLFLAAAYLPHHQIGGDYFDYIKIDDDRFLITIADVSGKGIPAAILMSNFQASLKTLIRVNTNLEEVVKALNTRIFEVARGDNFITFFGAIINKQSKKIEYINSGHNPQLLYCYDAKTFQTLDKGSTILGVFDPLPFVTKQELVGHTNYLIVNYTDGVTECRNKNGEEFGIERLKAFIKENETLPINELKEKLLHTLDDFSEGEPFFDDITFLFTAIHF